MWDGVNWVVKLPQERLQHRVADRFHPVVDRQHRRHIGMNHEPGERAQNLPAIVWLLWSTTLRMCNRHDGIDSRKQSQQGLQSGCDLTSRGRRARTRAQNHHGVSRPDAAAARATVTLEMPRFGGAFHGRCGNEGTLFQHEGTNLVAEISLKRQRGGQGPFSQRTKHGRVGHVVARSDRAHRATEGQAPRPQRVANRDRAHRKTMPLKDGVAQHAVHAIAREVQSGIEPLDRNGDVVRGCGKPGDGKEGDGGRAHPAIPQYALNVVQQAARRSPAHSAWTPARWQWRNAAAFLPLRERYPLRARM